MRLASRVLALLALTCATLTAPMSHALERPDALTVAGQARLTASALPNVSPQAQVLFCSPVASLKFAASLVELADAKDYSRPVARKRLETELLPVMQAQFLKQRLVVAEVNGDEKTMLAEAAGLTAAFAMGAKNDDERGLPLMMMMMAGSAGVRGWVAMAPEMRDFVLQVYPECARSLNALALKPLPKNTPRETMEADVEAYAQMASATSIADNVSNLLTQVATHRAALAARAKVQSRPAAP